MLKRFIMTTAASAVIGCTPSHAAITTQQEILQEGIKALACYQVTGRATQALRFVVEGTPYEVYYAATLMHDDINDYQRWVLSELFKGLEQVDLTLDNVLDFAEVWAVFCQTAIGQGTMEIEKRPRGDG